MAIVVSKMLVLLVLLALEWTILSSASRTFIMVVDKIQELSKNSESQPSLGFNKGAYICWMLEGRQQGSNEESNYVSQQPRNWSTALFKHSLLFGTKWFW